MSTIFILIFMLIRGVIKCVTPSKIYFHFSLLSYCFIIIIRDAAALNVVNTEACEQTFNWVNKFTNVKSMNESNFYIFFSVIFDYHNLHNQGMLRSTANPMSSYRWSLVENVEEIVPSLLNSGNVCTLLTTAFQNFVL